MIEPPRYFLDVERSVSGRAWLDRLDADGSRAAQAMSQQSDISEILARVAAGRGVPVEQLESFLNPTLRALMPDPSTLTGMDTLAERLASAVEAGEDVAIFADYDVDGACSAALLARYFKAFGLEPVVYIPDRIFEGYGPNIPAIDRLLDDGATLLVTLDCGTTSTAAIAHARARGVDPADRVLAAQEVVEDPTSGRFPEDLEGDGAAHRLSMLDWLYACQGMCKRFSEGGRPAGRRWRRSARGTARGCPGTRAVARCDGAAPSARQA